MSISKVALALNLVALNVMFFSAGARAEDAIALRDSTDTVRVTELAVKEGALASSPDSYLILARNLKDSFHASFIELSELHIDGSQVDVNFVFRSAGNIYFTALCSGARMTALDQFGRRGILFSPVAGEKQPCQFYTNSNTLDKRTDVHFDATIAIDPPSKNYYLSEGSCLEETVDSVRKVDRALCR